MKRISRFDKIAIISHIRPDGDTVGASLALYRWLADQGKRVELFCDSQLPDCLCTLPNADKYTDVVPDTRFDAVVAVDCGADGRLGRFYNFFKKHSETFNIDHHISNNRFAKYNHIKPDLSSTCEVVYDLFKEWGVALDYQIALCLYSGLFTDTGGFSHSNATAKVHVMAADLIAYGLDVAEIAFTLYKERSWEKIKLTERVMRTLKLFLDNRIAMVTITKKDIAESGCAENDVDGFIEIATSVKGTLASVSILEYGDNCYKVGLRSKTNKINVAQIAERWGGGGHVRASGFMTNGFYEDIVDKIVRVFSEVVDQ